MFDRFSDHARASMGAARDAAARLGRDAIDTEHLLLGLCADPSNEAGAVLAWIGQEPGSIARAAESCAKRGSGSTQEHHPFTAGAKRALEMTMYAATNFAHDVISSAHLLVGLLDERDGLAARVLAEAGVGAEAVRTAVLALFPPGAGVGGVDVASPVTAAWRQAHAEASRRKQPKVEVAHLLLALLNPDDAFVVQWVTGLGLDLESVRASLRRELGDALDGG